MKMYLVPFFLLIFVILATIFIGSFITCTFHPDSFNYYYYNLLLAALVFQIYILKFVKKKINK